MSDLLIFDTSVLIDDLRTGRHQHKILATRGLIRTSSVALAELWRGVTKPEEQRFVRAMERNHPVLVPTKNNWLDSGQVLSKIRADTGFAPEKPRDLHFDVLIALTARSCGARLISSNKADFELVRGYRKFDLEIW